MNIFPSRAQFESSAAAAALLTMLDEVATQVELDNAQLYRTFPLYKDDDENIVVADAILLTPRYGVVAFAITEASGAFPDGEKRRCSEIAEQVPPYIQSRLIKNRSLRRSPTQLQLEISAVTFAPLVTSGIDEETPTARTTKDLKEFFDGIAPVADRLEDAVFKELSPSPESEGARMDFLQGGRWKAGMIPRNG